MRILVLLVLIFPVLLSGCATPGTLKTDIEGLDQAFLGAVSAKSLIVVFARTPGGFSSRRFVQGGGGVDSESIAVEMAEVVFSKAFAGVYIDAPIKRDVPEDLSEFYSLLIKARSSTSRMDGAHTAGIQAVLADEAGRVLWQGNTEQVVYDGFQYGQRDTMQRAFLAAYRDIAVRLREHLQSGKTGSEKPNKSAGAER